MHTQVPTSDYRTGLMRQPLTMTTTRQEIDMIKQSESAVRYRILKSQAVGALRGTLANMEPMEPGDDWGYVDDMSRINELASELAALVRMRMRKHVVSA